MDEECIRNNAAIPIYNWMIFQWSIQETIRAHRREYCSIQVKL